MCLVYIQHGYKLKPILSLLAFYVLLLYCLVTDNPTYYNYTSIENFTCCKTLFFFLMLLPLKSPVTDIKVTFLAFLFAFVQFLCEPFNCEPICITSFLKLCFLPILPNSVLLCDIVWNFFFNKEMEQISSYSYHDVYS